MDIYIDHETICISCEIKGYSFGYSFKTIKYKNTTVLDLPTRHLNGPCLTFSYKDEVFLIKSLENAYQKQLLGNKHTFSMINSRIGKYISRFTYQYLIEEEQISKILEYVDTYTFEKKPYFLMFYSFWNLTQENLENLNFYQFFDFDIYGQDFFDTDCAKFDSKLQVVYQYDRKRCLDESIIVGIGSINDNPPTRFECNSPQEIYISKERKDLRNIERNGPKDCAVALQWTKNVIEPNQLIIFPVMVVFGFGKEEFQSNVVEARLHLNQLNLKIPKVLNHKTRQFEDPKLKKLSFSTKKWCV